MAIITVRLYLLNVRGLYHTYYLCIYLLYMNTHSYELIKNISVRKLSNNNFCVDLMFLTNK